MCAEEVFFYYQQVMQRQWVALKTSQRKGGDADGVTKVKCAGECIPKISNEILSPGLIPRALSYHMISANTELDM